MRTLKTPVCIIGAGPAGIITSLFLSQYGIDHVLAERQSLPRDKVCGETFFGRVVHVLKEVDPNWEKELIDKNIITKTWDIHVFFGKNSKKTTISFPKTATPIIKARRAVFDKALLDKAQKSPHLSYFDNCFITEIQTNTEGVRLFDKNKSMMIEAALVVVCIGDKQAQLNHIFPDYVQDGCEWLASRRYYKNAYYENGSYGSETYIYTQPIPHAVYTSRLPDDYTMIEIMLDKRDAKKINYKLDNFLEQNIQDTRLLKTRFTQAEFTGKVQGISMLIGSNPRKLSDERFLLAGSAMGSIHPITGCGVGHAMRSGQLAAYWAAQSIQKNDFSAQFLKGYDKAVKSRFRLDLLKGKMYAWGIKYPRLTFPLTRLLALIQIVDIKIKRILMVIQR